MAVPMGSGTGIAMKFLLPTECSRSFLCCLADHFFESPWKFNNSVIPPLSHLNQMGLSFKAATATNTSQQGKWKD
jgi:hypothetical protein